MDLTPKGFKKSEVTENKELVKVGTFLTYTDVCNYQIFKVIEVRGNLAEVKNTDGGFEHIIDLDALQLGWKFAMTSEVAPKTDQQITKIAQRINGSVSAFELRDRLGWICGLTDNDMVSETGLTVSRIAQAVWDARQANGQ